MKKIIKLFTVAIAVSLAAVGCNRDAADFGSEDNKAQGTGYISFANDPLSVDWEGENVNQTRVNDNLGNFWISIYPWNDDSEAIDTFQYKDRLEKGSIALPFGEYKIVIISDDEFPEAAFESPIWGYESPSPIQIAAEHTIDKPQTLGSIVCKLQQIKVTVWLEQNMYFNCSDDTEISVSLTEAPDHTLTFTKSTNGQQYGYATLDAQNGYKSTFDGPASHAYLKPTQAEHHMNLHLESVYDGQKISFDQEIATSAQAGQWRKIYLYIDEKAPEGGTINVIKVIIEDWVYDTLVETATISVKGMQEDKIGESDGPGYPEVSADGLGLNTVMEVSAANFSGGVYQGDASVSINTQSPAKNFEVAILTDNSDFQNTLKGIGMDNGSSVDLWTETSAAVTRLRQWGFPNPATQQRASNISFNIAEFFNTIQFNEGTHILTMAITDSQSQTTTVTVTIVISENGGTTTPPNPPTPPVGDDTAPTVVWDGYDLEQTHTIDRKSVV